LKIDKTCFVIGPIGDEGSPIRQHADWVLDGTINPALAELQLQPDVRSDKIAKPGMIDSQVISGVLDADLVIADPTLQNPNAFYELALRHMVEKPIIHLIHKSEKDLIPFDLKPVRTVFISWVSPGEVQRSIRELKAFIEAAISPDHDVENPVTRARGRQHLKETATPTEKMLIEEMQALTARMGDFERAPRSHYPVNALTGWSDPQGMVFVSKIDPNIYNQVSPQMGATFVTAASGLAQEFRSAPTAGGRAAVRNGKPANLVGGRNALSDMVDVLVDGELHHLTKEEWSKLPDWSGVLP